MPEPDLPPQKLRALEPDLPPQKVLLYAAAGGFFGALLAIIVARILAGPCCCPEPGDRERAASTLTELVFKSDRTLLA